MERLDYYDITPKGMDPYLSSHGHHFSKPMLEWAVGMMRNREGEKVKVVDVKQIKEKMKSYGIELNNDKGFYDCAYVHAMAMADYWGSSLQDEPHLLKYVKDYMDDIDGNPTRAFDEFYVNCIAKGVDIPWEDVI